MKKILLVLLVVLIAGIGFLGIRFGTALYQEENTTEILIAIVKLEFSNKQYIQVNDSSQRTYVSKNKMDTQGMIINDFMKQHDWRFVEQMGSGYTFEKDGVSVVVGTRLFTSNYFIWNVPSEVFY